MKKFFTLLLKFFKYIGLGIIPALQGALAVYDLQQAIKYLGLITSATGWQAVSYGFYAFVFFVLMLWFVCDLGRDLYDTMLWRTYQKEIAVNNVDNSSCDCETSKEANN